MVVKDNLDRDNFECFLIMCWAVWNQKIKFMFQRDGDQGEELKGRALWEWVQTYVQQYSEVNFRAKTGEGSNVPMNEVALHYDQCWKPPLLIFLK